MKKTKIVARLVIPVFLISLFSGCAANPKGSAWAVADFNKYNQNYAPFPTAKLRVGQRKEEVMSILGKNAKIAEAGMGYEVMVLDKWVSVIGPDYVEEKLFLKFENGNLANWKVQDSTVSIVPRSW